MKCMDCDQEVSDQNDHWADCTETPDYARYQAKAERRVRAGGPLAPLHQWGCGWRMVNRIDRGLSESCQEDMKDSCPAAKEVTGG